MQEVKKAVIPVAGWGTRMLPATKSIPKELLPLEGRPALDYLVEELCSSGVEELLLVTSRHKRVIEEYCQGRHRGIKIFYRRQKTPLGLGHAVSQAQGFTGSQPFAVLLGDAIFQYGKDPPLRQMIEAYYQIEATVVGVQRLSPAALSKHGIPGLEERLNPCLWRIGQLIEKPSPERAPSGLGTMGRYLLLPSIYPLLDRIKADSQGELQLTTALDFLASRERVYVYLLSGRRFDLGSKAGYLKALMAFSLQGKGPPGFREYLEEIVGGGDNNGAEKGY